MCITCLNLNQQENLGLHHPDGQLHCNIDWILLRLGKWCAFTTCSSQIQNPWCPSKHNPWSASLALVVPPSTLHSRSGWYTWQVCPQPLCCNLSWLLSRRFMSSTLFTCTNGHVKFRLSSLIIVVTSGFSGAPWWCNQHYCCCSL